jgi:PAS domain S-box-containing protein
MGPIAYLLLSILLLVLLFLGFKIRSLLGQIRQQQQSAAIQSRKLGQIENQLSEREAACQNLTIELSRLKEERAAELESLRHFRDLVEETEEFLFELDTQGRFLYTNPIMQRRLGYDAAELKDRHFYSFLLPEKTAEVQAFYKQQYLSRTRGTYAEWEALNRFGEPLFIGIRVNMTFQPDGKLESIMGSARDLSIQRALRKKNELFEEKLEPFFQSLNSPVVFLENGDSDRKTQIRWTNHAFCQLLELDRHRLQEMHLDEISLVLSDLVSEKRSAPEKQLVWQPKPDQALWFQILAWEADELIGLFLVDVSNAEILRRKESVQNEILNSAINALDAEVSLLDPEERYSFANESFKQRNLLGPDSIGKTEEERAKSSHQNLERALFWKSKLDEVKLIGSRIRFEELMQAADDQVRMISRDVIPFPWPNSQQPGFILLGQDVTSQQTLELQQLEARDRLFFYWRTQYSSQPIPAGQEQSEDVCSAYFGEPMVPGSPLDCFGEVRFVHYFPYTSDQLSEFQRIHGANWKSQLQVRHPDSYAESGMFYFPSVLISEALHFLFLTEPGINAALKISGAAEPDSFFQFQLSGLTPDFGETKVPEAVQLVIQIFRECGFSVTQNQEEIVFQGRVLWANKPDPNRLNLPIPILKGKRVITGPGAQRKVAFYIEELSLHGAEVQSVKSVFGINKLLEEGDFHLFVWWGDLKNEWKELDQQLLKSHGIEVLVYTDRKDESQESAPYIVKTPPANLKMAVEDAWRYSGSGKPSAHQPGTRVPVTLRFEKVLEITEGDKGFMQSLFESYLVSLEECQASFEKHLLQKDADALKFLLHKVRATIKTFEIRELDSLLRTSIEAVETQTIRNSSDRTLLVDQMASICQEARTSLMAFARNQGISLKGFS